MVNKEELRESLKALDKRKSDGIDILSAISGVDKEKIKKFIEGEDNLDFTETMIINMYK
jgi:hypothetical protein